MFHLIKRRCRLAGWSLAASLLCLPILTRAVEPAWDALQTYNVVWDSPGPDSTGSMPVGNGDIGLNVWVEKGGDLLFYIGKTDAWGLQAADNDPKKTQMSLLKVGRVRVSLSPAPATDRGTFRQELDLKKAEIRVTTGTAAAPVQIRVWVDANRPVIHVQARSAQPVGMKVSAESWRVDPAKADNADVFVPGQKDRVEWYFYRPQDPVNKEITGATFGAALRGEGLANTDAQTLASSAPRTAWNVEAHVLTAPEVGPDGWLGQMDQQIARTNQTAPPAAEREHAAWWQAFWNRGWIYADGPDARKATQGYVLQHFITACAGRGAFPIKFNGSIFVSDYPRTYPTGGKPLDVPANADFRCWGGAYWFQNTRLMYWAMLSARDYDLMPPIFGMVANPYTTVLGPAQYAATRINLAAACNGIGWIFGPIAGGLFFYGKDPAGASTGSQTLWIPYAAIAVVVVILAVVFYFAPSRTSRPRTPTVWTTTRRAALGRSGRIRTSCWRSWRNFFTWQPRPGFSASSSTT